jgi:MYXO-CTERM domain-containing protein
VAALLCLCAASSRAQQLSFHPVVLDPSGKIEPWVTPPSRAYSQVALQAWQFLVDSPNAANGLPAFFTYPEYRISTLEPYEWVHNPASLFAMLTESGLRVYAFTGDRRALDLVQRLLDYDLAHGLTDPGDVWASVPYASSSPGVLEYTGADDVAACNGCGSGDGIGVIEPDKVGELGFAFLRFYEVTGVTRYLDAAVTAASVLAAKVRTGDEAKSPWPMRVYAASGQVREEYSANILGPIRLFDELIRLGLGQVDAYRSARATAWAWALQYPMQNENWSGYFEDVPIMTDPSANRNQYIPLELARYLLKHPSLDPDWKTHATALLAFAERVFGADAVEPGLQWGALTMSEQEFVFVKMGSHTARYGSVLALWASVAGGPDDMDRASRSLNWATYFSDGAGHVAVVNEPTGPDSTSWFTDGYGDYIRHFMAAMEANPAWAPPGETHLVGSTSVVSSIEYTSDRVTYRTFDAVGTEVLRVPQAPVAVWVGNQRLPAGGFGVAPTDSGDLILTVQHSDSGSVVVDFRGNYVPPSSGCSTTGQPAWAAPIVLLGLLLRRRSSTARSGARARPTGS